MEEINYMQINMKKLFLLLLIFVGANTFGQKIKDLTRTTTGSTSDLLLKDDASGVAGSTKTITVANFIATYFGSYPTGSGTTNFIPLWSSSSGLTNSYLSQSGLNIKLPSSRFITAHDTAGCQIDLNYGGKRKSFNISTDRGQDNEAWVYGDSVSSLIGFGGSSTATFTTNSASLTNAQGGHSTTADSATSNHTAIVSLKAPSVRVNGTFRINSGSPSSGKVWTATNTSGDGSWQTPSSTNSLTSSHIFVGNGSNIATDVAMTGDVTINNSGVTAIGTSKVLPSMIATNYDETGTTIYNKSYWKDLTDFTKTGSFTDSISTHSAYNLVLASTASSYTVNVQVGTYVTPDELLDYECTFQITSTVSSSKISISRQSVSSGNYFPLTWQAVFDGSTGSIQLYNPSVGTVKTLATGWTLGANDIYRLRYSQRGNVMVATIFNVTQGLVKSVSFQSNWGYTAGGYTSMTPNSGKFCINPYWGNFNISNIRIVSYQPLYPNILFVGDSKTAGLSGGNGTQFRFASLCQSLGSVAVMAGSGDQTADALRDTSYIKYFIHPKYVIMCIGRNDLSAGVSSGTWQANYSALVAFYKRIGTTFIHLMPIPETVQSQTALTSYINSTFPSDLKITPSSGWVNSVHLAADGIHPTQAGHRFIWHLIDSVGYITASAKFIKEPVNWIDSVGATGSVTTLAGGGTNASLTASNGGIFYSTASAGAILSGTATANKILMSGSSSAPSWSTCTYPSTAGTANGYLRSDGTNLVMSSLALPNSGTANKLAYCSSTNTLGFATNAEFDGTALTVTNSSSSNAGRILINCTSTGNGNIGFQQNGVNKSAFGWVLSSNTAVWGNYVYSGNDNMLFLNSDGSMQFKDPANSSAVRVTFAAAGNVGIGTTTISAKLHTLSTTEQLRLGYDASNYLSTTVSSAGAVTLDATGSSAGFTLSDKLTVSNPIKLKNYTVATLPAGSQGDIAYVTDALAPTYGSTVVGGGAIVTLVFYDGANWTAH